MQEFENNALFWQKLDTIILSSKIVIDYPKNSSHKQYPNLIYPVDYGYLKDTTSTTMDPINLYVGTSGSMFADAIIIAADILKKDCVVKVLVGCTETEINEILTFVNSTEFQKTLIIYRGDEIPEWTSD